MKIFLLTFTFAFVCCKALIYDELIRELSAKVAEGQVKESTAYIPGVQWGKHKGEYPGYMMFNFNGDPEQVLLRENWKLYDNCMFVTVWTTIMLIEASMLPGGPPIGEDQLMSALDAFQDYHDHNQPNGSSIMAFWLQRYNETTGIWFQDATNIGPVIRNEKVLSDVANWILDGLHIKEPERLKNFTTLVQDDHYFFHIPPDADDTFTNIELGSILKQHKKFQKAYLKWLEVNPDITSAVATFINHSYQPFGDKLNNSFMDPRVYFYIREYLNKIKKTAKSDYKLPATWLINLHENTVLHDKNVRMPFNVPTTDLSVSADILYGITAAVFSDMNNPKVWFNDDLQEIYQNAVDLIVYQVQSNMTSRPDIALSYYPSKFVFYWFLSRLLLLFKSSDPQLMYPVMEKVSHDLETLLRGYLTDILVKSANHDKSGAYFDEFLGKGDKDIDGNPINNAEDRIFTTAMAANTLLYTWREGTNLNNATPPAVITTIQQLCGWLAKYTLSGSYKPHNAFFSGTFKNIVESMPYYYPANYKYWLNGTELSEQDMYNVTFKVEFDSAVGVLGMIDEDEYNQLLKEKHFGRSTPVDFSGYNTPLSHFPFWSSNELTYATVLLSLTQCQYLFD